MEVLASDINHLHARLYQDALPTQQAVNGAVAQLLEDFEELFLFVVRLYLWEEIASGSGGIVPVLRFLILNLANAGQGA